MDRNTQYILAYDGDCKICKRAVNLAQKLNILPSNNYIPIQSLKIELAYNIDLTKARNEVPLINLSDNEVLYGIDSVLKLIALKWQIFESLSKLKFVRLIFSFLYFLISYNRTVISNKYNYCSSPICEPNFNIKYRGIYIILLTAFSSYIHFLIFNTLIDERLSFINTSSIFLAIFVIHFLAIRQFKSLEITFEYLGHLASTLCIYSILIFICFILSKMISLSSSILLILMIGCGIYTLFDLYSRIQNRIGGKSIILTVLIYIGFLIFFILNN